MYIGTKQSFNLTWLYSYAKVPLATFGTLLYVGTFEPAEDVAMDV